jgi:hypothetical protein
MPTSNLEHLVSKKSALEWEREEGASSWSSGSSSSKVLSRMRCTYCDYLSKATVDEAALLSELTSHLNSEKHIFLRSHGGGMRQLYSRARGLAPPPPPPPDLTRLCRSFYDKELEVCGSILKTDVLLTYDADRLDWCPGPRTWYYQG